MLGRAMEVVPRLRGAPAILDTMGHYNSTGSGQTNYAWLLNARLARPGLRVVWCQHRVNDSPAVPPEGATDATDGVVHAYLQRASGTGGMASTMALLSKVLDAADMVAGPGGVPALIIPAISAASSLAGALVWNCNTIDTSLSPASAGETATTGFSRSAGLDANSIASVGATPDDVELVLNFLGHNDLRTITAPSGWAMQVSAVPPSSLVSRYSTHIAAKHGRPGVATGTDAWTASGGASLHMTTFLARLRQ